MRDISARELKGHNILAVERFWDNTRWMIEFSVLRPSTAYGSPGDEMRLFLTEDGYQAALQSQQRREIKIKRYARVIEGHLLLNFGVCFDACVRYFFPRQFDARCAGFEFDSIGIREYFANQVFCNWQPVYMVKSCV